MMAPAPTPSERLGALLEQDAPVFAGGCYDSLSAAVLERAGFPALFVSGAGVSASVIGMPDLGLLSLEELVRTARNIINRSAVPVVVDADTGFGNELNVTRTIRELVRAGAAGVMLEDQTSPKRCGQLDGKDVVDADTFVRKIAAAADARGDSGMKIIARTDALAIHGLEESLSRVRRAHDAGADITFVEAPRTDDQVREIGGRSPGWPMYGLTGSIVPSYGRDELRELGFRFVTLPGVALMPMISEVGKAARAVLRTGSHDPLDAYDMVPRDIFETVGLGEWLSLGKRLSEPR
ncbi:isocitrate lyase/PEP mutase family protein [Streptosporangium sp. NPDC004631]